LENLLNKDAEEMAEGFTDDFSSLSSETAKSKLNSGNSKQPTDKTDIRGETKSTEPSVDMKSAFEEDWKPFDVSPDTSNQHQHLPETSQDIWPPLASTILSEDIETHSHKHWWGVIKKTTPDRKQISLRKSVKTE